MESFDMYDSVLTSEADVDAAIQEKTEQLDTLAQEINTIETEVQRKDCKISLLEKYVETHPNSKPPEVRISPKPLELEPKEELKSAQPYIPLEQTKSQYVPNKEYSKRPIRRIGFTSGPPPNNPHPVKRPRFETRKIVPPQRDSSHKNRILLVSCDNETLENKVIKYLKEKQFPVYNSFNRFKVATSHILDGKEDENFTKFIEKQTLKYFDEKFTVFHFSEWLTRNKLTKAFVFGMTKSENVERLKSKYNVTKVSFGDMGSIRPKCDWFIEFDSRDIDSRVKEVFDGYRNH